MQGGARGGMMGRVEVQGGIRSAATGRAMLWRVVVGSEQVGEQGEDLVLESHELVELEGPATIWSLAAAASRARRPPPKIK